MMKRTISFTLNGEPATTEIEPHHNLVEVLQRDFNLMGARESCGQGMCGCCTVLVNGTAVSGCLYLAAFADGAKVATVESLAEGDKLSRCRKPSLRREPFNAAIARRVSSSWRPSCSMRIPIPTTMRSGIICPATFAVALPIPRSSKR